MRKKIGLWMVLAILVSGPAIHPSPANGTAIREISNHYFPGQYRLYDGRLILKAKDHLKLTPEQEKKNRETDALFRGIFDFPVCPNQN